MENAALTCRCARPRGPAGSAVRIPWPCLLLLFVALSSAAADSKPAPKSRGSTQARPAAATLVHGPLASFSLPSIDSADYWLRLDTGLSVPRESLDAHWRSVVRSADSRAESPTANPEVSRIWSGLAGAPDLPRMFELDSTHLLASDPQRDLRPHFVLGNSSDSLRTWLRGAGLDASRCVAPLMKMHSTIDGTGPHTNVSVSARCSFH